MKDLIRNRWFVFLLGILIATVVLLGIGVILYGNGYRITYPQQFETSWDAVSGFAAWAGILVSIASAAASFFAIWFAVRVADKQNKIALFESRYKVFDVFVSCQVFASVLKVAQSKQDVEKVFLKIFGDTLIDSNEVDMNRILNEYVIITEKLKQSQFLFNNIEIPKYMKKLSEVLYDVVFLRNPADCRQKINAFLAVVDGKQDQNILNEIGKEMSLK